MRVRIGLKTVIVPIVCLIASLGCSLRGGVSDLSGRFTRMSGVHIRDASAVMVRDGAAMRMLSLRNVIKIAVRPDVTVFFDRRMFCQAEITLRDGSVMGTLATGKATTYIAADEYVCGKADGDPYCIMLMNVARLEMYW